MERWAVGQRKSRSKTREVFESEVTSAIDLCLYGFTDALLSELAVTDAEHLG